MIKTLKKLFGGINLTWPKLIISAIVAGILTAVIAMIPELHYTSFNAITVTFEVWILFGIIIIMNSKSNIDSALKCFVFFLISQPLVYLIQVPFLKQYDDVSSIPSWLSPPIIIGNLYETVYSDLSDVLQ